MKNKKVTKSSHHKGQCKDKNFIAQTEIVYKAFYKKPSTMLEVSVMTGIMRANICRYVDNWKKRNIIQVIRLGKCPVSKVDHVQILTTNPDLFSNIKMLTLFD